MALMTLDQQLDVERRMYGRDRRVPAPQLLRELWDRGRAAGYHLGTLFVLDAPLAAGTAGSYNRASGDVWVLHDSEHPERAAARLLHELGHAARRSQRPRLTIEGYYRDEVATQRLAYTLARRWGVAHLFTAQTRDAYIALMERRREELPAAGDLAGSHALHVADACLDELQRLAQTHGWSEEQWEEVLWGDGDDVPSLAAVAELDRCRLRHSWSLGWGYGEGFEALTLPPSADAARLVRRALTDVARRRSVPARCLLRARRTLGGAPYRTGYIPLWSGRDLVPALAAANALLLGAERWSAEATWSMYGAAGDSCRIYALEVSYHAPIGEPQDGKPPAEGRLWCPLFGGMCAVDAALQLYIRGWRRCAALRTGSLRDAWERQAGDESTVPR